MTLDGAPGLGDGTGDPTADFFLFPSEAEDLVELDLNAEFDLFVREISGGVTTRVSLDSDGDEIDDWTSFGALSRDGSHLCFQSYASGLVDDPRVLPGQVYLRPRALDRAATSVYGSGLAGRHGVPAIATDRVPSLGQHVTLEFDNSYGKWTVAVVLLGTESAQIPTGFGADLLVATEHSEVLAIPPAGGEFLGDVPADEFLAGLEWYAQALILDPFAVEGVAFTAGLAITLGW